MESLPMPHYTEKSWHHFSPPPLLTPNLPAHQLTEWTGEHHAPCGTSLFTLGNIKQCIPEQTDAPPQTKLKNKQQTVI
jgi:hypothetical protein